MMATSTRVAHSTPLVLGSSSPSRRSAGRSARPDALEAGLDHVMRVLAAHRQVQRGARGCRRASERNAARARSAARRPARGRSCPSKTKYGAARQIERHLRLALIHRQQEAVAADAGLVAERLAQRLAERERAVLDRVVLVDVQIAAAVQLQRESRRAWRAARACDRRSRCRWRCGSAALRRARRATSIVGFARACARRARGARAGAARSPASVSSALPSRRTRRPRDAEIAREFQIGVAIADHGAARAIDRRARADTRSPGRCAACGRRSPRARSAGR